MEILEIMKKSFLMLAVLSVLTFAGCKSTKIISVEDSMKYKYVGEWTIESLSGFDGKMVEATMTILPVEDVEDVKYPYELSVTGFSGVNRYFATIKGNKEKHELPIGNNMGSTKMMGSPEEMEFEDALIELLCTAESWVRKGNTLTISNGKLTAVYTKGISDK